MNNYRTIFPSWDSGCSLDTYVGRTVVLGTTGDTYSGAIFRSKIPNGRRTRVLSVVISQSCKTTLSSRNRCVTTVTGWLRTLRRTPSLIFLTLLSRDYVPITLSSLSSLSPVSTHKSLGFGLSKDLLRGFHRRHNVTSYLCSLPYPQPPYLGPYSVSSQTSTTFGGHRVQSLFWPFFQDLPNSSTGGSTSEEPVPTSFSDFRQRDRSFREFTVFGSQVVCGPSPTGTVQSLEST